jgi:hypothetical protein
MTHTDYTTEALKTWTAPLRGAEEGRTYLVLGLLSELGEVADVMKKAIRNGTPKDEVRRRLVDKIGDVLWYSAMIQHEGGLPAIDHELSPWLEYVARGISVADLLTHVSFMYGITAEECRTANIAKLRDRAARGVIAGEGGSR